MSRSPSPANVTVTVPARLHLGFLDLNGGLGRRFGSIGLAINGLRTSITISAASHMGVTGPDNERVLGYLQTMQRALDSENACHVSINEVVPAHAGLGSGTQIALAVAAGVRRFHGLPLDVRGDAIRLGRGARSGVGIGLFDHGGLVVDGGRGSLTTAAPVVSRIPFPDQWRILVVLDPHRQGVHGADERDVFSKLAPFSDAEAAHLCRLVLMKALPALAECDIAAFGSAIKEMQMLLGEYFAAIQGGSRFSRPDVAAALGALEEEGAYGIGQSSWGPTGFAFAPSAEEANRLLESIRRHPRCRDLDIRAVTGLNRGAQIVSHVGADEPERHQR
ncbi:MAG: beta-ribofuranosylaminobenzene 5'-phosphate synthase family protein [Xanthobacteraceae bacterium]